MGLMPRGASLPTPPHDCSLGVPRVPIKQAPGDGKGEGGRTLSEQSMAVEEKALTPTACGLQWDKQVDGVGAARLGTTRGLALLSSASVSLSSTYVGRIGP